MRTFRPAHLCNALLVMWASANNPNSYNKESGHAFDRWLNAIPKGTQFTYGQALDELSEFEWYGETSHIKSFVKKAEKAGRVRLQIRGKGKRPNVFIKL
ncbi:MAG: hypothetical protein QNJ46_06010 [Leptolyngbyaceae cyanobacterium MO_188.B28]|nr:hypothetical protein [Leptolyngbyaceae cyanobacterium MO_188.B28]